jgi:tetratricopeptide (TPR) repeat protein
LEEKVTRVGYFSVCLLLLSLFAAMVSGCVALGFSKEGAIIPIEQPAMEARARALLQFNKATELLVEARNPQTGEIDIAKLDEAVSAYKEAEKLSPNDIETQKQLGIVYEFFKKDEKTAYVYYKKYVALGGTDQVIVAAVEELAEKSEPPKDEGSDE